MTPLEYDDRPPYHECPRCGGSGKSQTMVSVRGVYDGGLYMSCLVCEFSYHRWKSDGEMRRKAEPYILAQNEAVDLSDKYIG